MKDERDSCSSGSSFSGICKNILNKTPTPICMFYFSHPFGISTPSTANNVDNDLGRKKTTKKSSKYTTTTYLVTEIQKNHSDESQDECQGKKQSYTDRDLIPWPKNFLLPPLVQLLEKKHGKKPPDIDAILRQVRKQAWNTPKSHQSCNFWSRGSSVSSDDFSSLASPDSVNDKVKLNRMKLKQKSKNTKQKNMETSENSGNGRGKSQQIFLKRRYSVPEIIMRKYSLAQQKSSDESSSNIQTTSSEAFRKSRNGQSTTNKKPTPPQPATTSNTRTSTPIKYFIPLSPQQQQQQHTSSSSSNCMSGGGSGGFLNTEISMRKQTLLRRMWSREFQHSKYSGSWSPPLRRSSHQSQSGLKKFNTLPEIASTSCEKCKELGVLARNFDEEIFENKENKSQQTDFDLEGNSIEIKKSRRSSESSRTSDAIHSTDVNVVTAAAAADTSPSKFDTNGNNIIICMTALQEPRHQPCEDTLRVEIDNNNNADMIREKILRKQFSTQIDDQETTITTTPINYKRLNEENLNETEIDEYISQMLIQNLETVIKTVNENLQANGERNLVRIDYHSNGDEDGYHNNNNKINNNKFGNQHEISIQMRNAKNGDTIKSNRNSNEVVSPSNDDDDVAVERGLCGDSDGKSQLVATFDNNHQHYIVSNEKTSRTSETGTDTSEDQQHFEVTAIINSGTSYPEIDKPESIYVPRFIGPKTESMEVNPSSSSAQEDDEFDGVEESEEEEISDVDSLDDLVTVEARKLHELAHHQHKKAQSLFRQTHLKGQAFFVPIVDTEQPIDEHIVVAEMMPEKLKEKLILRQRRRDMKKQSEMKIKQWRMQKFIERKMGEVKLVDDYIEDFSKGGGGAFKIIGMPSKKLGPIQTNTYRRESSGGQVSGWMPKPRLPPSALPTQLETVNEAVVEKVPQKPKKLRNEIGMLESYKIDGRGNMQIQNPNKPEKPTTTKAKIKRNTIENKKPIRVKTKTALEVPSRKSNASSKRTTTTTTTSSSTTSNVDVRRRQVMKDVQQMSMYKTDLTPDPDSGPSRKMWKTEIQEGDKHIEILEIVECVDGTSSTAPDNNNFNHIYSSPSTSTQNHNYYHVTPSSDHPTIVNKTFSVRTSGYGDSRDSFPSRIPIPIHYRNHFLRGNHRYEARESSPSNNNYSSSTDPEDSLTSAGSSRVKQTSKVDRMIANLLMEALKSPEDLGIEFVNSPKMRKPKRRSQSYSPGGVDSSGYFTADSSSRRSASNSASKYQHRFEVIPEEKSSFSVDSSNDDFIEDDEVEQERLENINSDWKSRKNLQNNDIKTRSVTPKSEKEDDIQESEKSKSQKVSPSVSKKSPTKSNQKSSSALTSSVVKSTLKSSPAKRDIKTKKSSSGGESSSANASTDKKSEPEEAKSFITFSDNCEQGKEDEETSQAKTEDAFPSPHLEHKNLIHHFMNNKSSSSSSSNNHHFHYHLYQYQTHNCCFNLFDPCKTSSTVTTETSNENFSSLPTQSIRNSCQTADFMQSRNTKYDDEDDDKLKTAASSKFTENSSFLKGSGSDNNQSRINEASSPQSNSIEKVIEVKYSNENYKKPEDDQDNCSCTKKYFPYKINEKNVWQVYETSDCKYIQSKYEVDEIFHRPDSSDGNQTPSTCNPLLHSRSNFNNSIICHTINHETEHDESSRENDKNESVNNSTPFDINCTDESLYTPSFNIKSATIESCKCIDEEMTEDNSSKVIDNDDDDDDVDVASIETKQDDLILSSKGSSSFMTNTNSSGKLLNRPKATNNISRDQVQPVEKEIQNEITRNGVKVSPVKTSVPIRLPSPIPNKHQETTSKSKNFDNDDGDYSEADYSSDGTVIEKKRSPKVKSNQSSPKEHSKVRQPSSLVRQENKNVVIPNIHQGWSVTVAGTHPDLAPDVEMKLSFPKAKGATSTPDSKSEKMKQDHPEVFYYKNNQLLPPPVTREIPTQLQYERFEHKPYYNHRRSLSLARIDSGLSGMIKPKSYKLPNLHVPRSTARNAFKVECTTISASKTFIPSRRSMSLDVGNRRLSLDSRSQASPNTSSDLLSVVGSEIKKTLKPKVKTMSERDLTKRHLNCFTRNNGMF